MIVSTNFVPHGFDALTLWPFIFVRPWRRGNVPLIEHELVHYREQAWVTPFWIARYLCSRSFRLQAEVRAYTRQIELGGITCEQAASMLVRYNLKISYAEALKHLTPNLD